MTLSQCLALTGLILALAGCGRDDIKVQRVPKEGAGAPTMARPESTAAPANTGAQTAGQPQLKWTLPSGWEEKAPTSMRAASFTAKGRDGQVADVAVIPLPGGGAAMELATLDMWRNELKASTTEKIEPTPVAIGSSQGKLFEIGGGEIPGRILVGALDREGTTWYFKMKGDDALVREQKPVFVEFLKSISFGAPSAVAAAPAVVQPATAPQSSAGGRSLPAGWQEAPPTQFAMARFVIPGNGDSKAEMTVSSLAGDGGGFLANVNRWRQQLGLERITADVLASQATELEVVTGKAKLVDMSGTDVRSGRKARIVGVVAPQAGQTWFYKLMGDEQVVEQQKQAFTEFVKAADYSNAR